jgi:hypothetical protein
MTISKDSSPNVNISGRIMEEGDLSGLRSSMLTAPRIEEVVDKGSTT